jgi:hypothetical protein
MHTCATAPRPALCNAVWPGSPIRNEEAIALASATPSAVALWIVQGSLSQAVFTTLGAQLGIPSRKLFLNPGCAQVRRYFSCELGRKFHRPLASLQWKPLVKATPERSIADRSSSNTCASAWSRLQAWGVAHGPFIYRDHPAIMVVLVRCIGLRLPDGRRSDLVARCTLDSPGDAALIESALSKGLIPAGRNA